MLIALLLCVELLAALGSGLVAGVFFAFSTFVMRGLKSLPPEDAIKAMNAINVAAVRPPLMTLLFGTALLCLVTITAVPWVWGLPTRWIEIGLIAPLLGGIVYLFGAVLVTMKWNVPLNRALAARAHGNDAVMWNIYVRDWVKWNHVRTLACAVACALLTAGVGVHLAWVTCSRCGTVVEQW